ncbi:MAG: NAD-glutamate dehydrogenase domain-containing protein, partial [Gammaproteobacteria bacterium]
TTMVSFHQALIDNPKVSRLLFDYFEARFRPVPEWDDPGIREERMLFPLRLQLLESIENVSGINDDRILRTLFNLIDATVRSNFHVRKEVDEYFVAFKINSLGVIEMPSPKPVFEIYVHAFDMEGIHLRGGKVSRGGIRWSDRPDDFRTEILGLMQTQMSKNALIIPKGAKGGFVVKHPRAGESLKESGKRAYVTLIRGLLDLTDNYVGAGVVGPPGIVSYDDEDPYLVVAADKGTAQFPDIANAVAEEYRYWLRDAFASGGSRGYSHKALGITARGAWECVKRHFRELGKDIQTQPFTVVGIGSMDGDVFGNGMLLSEQIRLRAAISGQHIFIDPSPREDGAPFVERRRLFELPGSSWDDYDRKLISEGGGVFHRDSKNIPVSSAIKNWLGIRYRSIDGETLIRYLLTAEVELLWLGGIGTYVKSGAEKHEEVGDRANDSVRVDAGQLKAAIVGEGANLGFTQKARVEFNLAGGKINTDAVDNSAGVDTSDHEVNIKILLNDLQKRGVVDDYQTLFEGISGEVCSDVLANNYAQSLCLSLDYLRCRGNPQRFMELADHLESAGLLDRAVESFPRPKQVMSRPEQRLTRPELAVLMSAAKIQLTQLLLDENDFVSADFCDLYLYSYFPEAIKEGFGAFLSSHPLAKDIKATYISNKIVNQAGCLFLNPIGETEAGEIIEGVAAYLTFDRALSGYSMRQALFGLDNQFDAEVQYGLLMQFEEVLSSICSWSLLHGDKIRPDEETLSYWLKSLEEYERYFNHHCCGEDNTAYQEKFAGLRDKGIPDEIARRLAFVFGLENFPLIVKLTVETGRSLERVLALFNELLEYLNLNIIGAQLAQLAIHDQWERKVLFDLKEDMKLAAGKLVGKIFDSGFENCAGFFEAVERRRKTSQYQRLCKQLCVSPPAALLPYVSIVRELERLLER